MSVNIDVELDQDLVDELKVEDLFVWYGKLIDKMYYLMNWWHKGTNVVSLDGVLPRIYLDDIQKDFPEITDMGIYLILNLNERMHSNGYSYEETKKNIPMLDCSFDNGELTLTAPLDVVIELEEPYGFYDADDIICSLVMEKDGEFIVTITDVIPTLDVVEN